MNEAKYYVMDSDYSDEGMMLGGMPNLPNESKDDWMYGQAFTQEPKEPIVVDIKEGEDSANNLPFYCHPPLASQEFIDALIEVGVDNLVLYDAVLKSRTAPNFQIMGYKAFNIIGLVKAAGDETEYATESREGDASIANLQADTSAIKGLYIFRLAESWDTIVVHEKVKEHLESKNFIGLDFEELDGAFIL